MSGIHLVFGSTLLMMFSVNLLLTLPGSESASFFDRVVESEPATAIKDVFGQLLPQQKDKTTQPDQASTTTPTTTTSKTASFIDRVIGHLKPQQQNEQQDQKSTSTTTSSTTTTSTTTTPGSSSKSDGDELKELGSATPPSQLSQEYCYLQKNESGVVKTVDMSRAEAGNTTYLDYEEVCTEGDEINTRISAGALASLAGPNVTTDMVGMTTMPTYNETCYLQKNDSEGVILTIYMSRSEAGDDNYLDYEEICDDGDDIPEPLSISAGALASLAG